MLIPVTLDVGGSVTQFGTTSPGASLDSNSGGYIILNQKVLSDNNALCTRIRAYLAGGGTSAQVVRGVLYAADGAGGIPLTLKAISAEISIAAARAAGWVEFVFASSVTLSSGNYWVGLWHGATNSG